MPDMRTTTLLILALCLCFSCLAGCQNRGDNQVIEGTGNEITPEMIEVEEAELETVE